MDGSAFIVAAHKVHPRMKFLIHTGSPGYSPSLALQQMGIMDRHLFRKPVADMSLIAQAIRDLIAYDGPSGDEGD